MIFNSMFDLDKRFLSLAANLAREGRVQSEVHWGPSEIFVINSDRTVLYRVETELSQDPPISFFSQDYSGGDEFKVENGRITFRNQTIPGYDVSVISSTPTTDFSTLKEVFDKSKETEIRKSSLVLDAQILRIIDASLSHVEIIKTDDGEMVVIQRDVFSGRVVYINKEVKRMSLFSSSSSGDIEENFEKIGIRTIDFCSLFEFDDEITFTFSVSGNMCWAKGETIQALLAGCVYDELGDISYYGDKNGWKEQKEGGSEQDVDTEVEDAAVDEEEPPRRRIIKRRQRG